MPALSTTLTRRDLYDAALDLLAPRGVVESRDFESDFNDQRNTVETGQRVIGGGIIAVIVIVVVGFIASCITGCVVFQRVQRRKNERRQMQQPPPGSAPHNPDMSYPNYGPHYGQPPQQSYGSGPGGPNYGPVPEPAPAYTPGHATGDGYKGGP